MTGARQLVLRGLGPAIRRAGSAYLAGSTRDAAVAGARRLAAAGHRVSLAYWNPPEPAPERVLGEGVGCVRDLAGWADAPRVAVKAPPLGLDAERVRRLALAARDFGVGLVFDAHEPAQADPTLALARVARAEGAEVGVALPARWRRSLDDVVSAAAGGLSVRLVKGQWPDPGGGSASERALRAAFLTLLDRLAAAGVPTVVATHDAVLVEAALARPSTGRPAEVELLFGLPAGRVLAAAARHRVPVRFYVPYGHPSISYSLSSVLRRPRLAVTLAQGVASGPRNRGIRLREALRSRS